MCASYGALESTLVSTRSTVPDTFASAAALTLASTSPVSSFSVLPLTVWPPFDGSNWGRAWLLLGAVELDELDELEPPVAAPAIAVPPSAAAPTAATVMSVDLRLTIGGVLLEWLEEERLRGSPRRARTAPRFAESAVWIQIAGHA